MGQPKKRRKKSIRAKKSRPKPQKASLEPALAEPAEEELVLADNSEQVEPQDESEGGGMMIGMRTLISGGKPVKEGFFSKRRTLAEWLVWFAGLFGLYHLYQYIRPFFES